MMLDITSTTPVPVEIQPIMPEAGIILEFQEIAAREPLQYFAME